MTEQTQVVEVSSVETEVNKEIAAVKSFVVYQFESETLAKEAINTLSEDLLLEHKFTPCQKHDALKQGFSAFDGVDDLMTLPFKGVVAMQVTTQIKRPHGAAVKKLCRIEETKYKEENELDKLDNRSRRLSYNISLDYRELFNRWCTKL